MGASSHAMDKPSHLCAVCLDFLQRLPEKVHETTNMFEKAKDQPLETFREAARQQCFICSALWNLSEKHRAAWSNPQHVPWTPMRFMARQEPADSLVRLNILYDDPIRGVTGDIRFRMISTNGIAPISRIIGNCNRLNLLRQRVRTPFLVQRDTTKHILA
ncbi:hypothetical protein K469DRAFT_696156 [Zopfia rhizophila CBS 207.26]|uniref:Heterokaryon incompatibility domain-containing protein n=1 Tax=Zopfia rhizophila CBS 207.26 TaxID=1314779 RepID=A0A6A6DKE1_9PEZI|nr:hypothetical protein K469DRAFT_696156 [Zopfia rhizophila CBS 207.26]